MGMREDIDKVIAITYSRPFAVKVLERLFNDAIAKHCAKAEAVVTAAKEMDENMCQSCLIDGENNPATGRMYTGTCGHRKKLRKALTAYGE